VLIGALQQSPLVNCSSTAAILKKKMVPVHQIHELIDFENPDANHPIGYARFMFRVATIPKDTSVALPFLDHSPLAILVGNGDISELLPATVSISIDELIVNIGDFGLERHIIRDYLNGPSKIRRGFNVEYVPLSHHYHQVVPKKYWATFKFFLDYRWVVRQLKLIKKDGVQLRLQRLKRKLAP